MIGRIIFVSNPNRIPDIIRSGPSQLVRIDEDNTYGPEVICGSILLPPYSIMSELIDDRLDLRIIEQQYFEYLHTNEPRSFVAGLLAIMFKGINVVIMVDKYDNEFGVIPRTLWNFINIRYGIMLETETNGFFYPTDPMYLDTIYSDLFLYDYIDDAVLKSKHSPHTYNEEVQMKLMNLYNLRATNNMNHGPIDPFISMR